MPSIQGAPEITDDFYADAMKNTSHVPGYFHPLSEIEEYGAMVLPDSNLDTLTSGPPQTTTAPELAAQILSSAPKQVPVSPWRCIYPGHNKSIARKGDWIRHMDKYHKPDLIAWSCRVPGCGRQFETEALFRQHHAASHHCRRSCTHADDARNPATPRLAFACGFTGCSALFPDWDNWRDHVRDHISTGTSVDAWQYSTELRNLLRRGEIAALWEAHAQQQLGTEQGYQHFFHWQPDSSANFKRQLEYSKLRDGVPHLVTSIFAAAVSVRSRVAPALAQNILTNNATNVSEHNFGLSSSVPSHQESNQLPVAAFAVTYDWSKPNPSYQFSNQQSSQSVWNDLSNPSTFGNATYGNPWMNTNSMEQQASHNSFASPTSDSPTQRNVGMWFPNMPSGKEDDPVAKFGFPENLATYMSPANTMESQHSRTKSSSSTSLTKKISSIFRKPNHSRSGSDNSDHRMGGMQMNI
jgi:hypothetical protein